MQTGVIHRTDIPYDTEDPAIIAQMNDEMQAIECMTVVWGLSFVPAGASPAGFQANLKCRGARASFGVWGQKGLC